MGLAVADLRWSPAFPRMTLDERPGDAGGLRRVYSAVACNGTHNQNNIPTYKRETHGNCRPQ